MKDREQQYKILQENREKWSSSVNSILDRSNQVILLDGQRIDSVPNFYITLGKVVNGRNGYFGACLDSLYDCFCGGFGIKLPVTIEIKNHQVLRNRLTSKVILNCDQIRSQSKTDTLIVENSNYFDQVIEVFKDVGVVVRLT